MENHLLFSDESGYCGKHRFGSIAVISGSKTNTKNLNTELKSILDKYNKSELKFAKVKGHNSTNKAVKEFISIGLKYCFETKIKIHVIIWDTKDSRHQVQGRDDIGNMKRMYYHILKRAKTDWNGIENWEFYPDEFSAINWQNVVNYIESTNLDKAKNTNQNTLFGIFSNIRFPFVHKHSELESNKFPILQLADLFAGLIRLSYECGDKYEIWLSNESKKETLFPDDKILCNASKNEKCKFEIMKHFKETCSKFKLGVNFSMNKYFITFHAKNGIVIWLYKPQGEYDKAPTNNN